MQETIWSLFPAIIAISLALFTKEVYISLLAGILSGALFFTSFHIPSALETTFAVMSDKVGGNMNIIVFLILLGMLVALLNRSGASNAYGTWASNAIRTKRGALGATALLGAMIFVDDYFNCLTVGTVMHPVTDRHNISRAKLAYIIDAVAAPVCIIAPVSSWAAAVGSSMPENTSIDGFRLFLQTIPFNFYAILTLIMVVFLIIFQFDFGAMKKYEAKLNTKEQSAQDTAIHSQKGNVFDLIIPIASLILFCLLAMLYTGGILNGKSIGAAFANCNSSLSLVFGSFFTILLVFLLYIPRKIISFTDFANSLVEGFKAMVPAILILSLAWTLSGICGEGYLNVGGYVSRLVSGNQMAVAIMPPVFFLTGLGLAFATGTSWGTFAILIPIAISVFGDTESSLLVITVASILAGAVCGDHISPISDTTILSSTGARCSHIDHVSTQIPYALLTAGCSLIGYGIAGITENGWLALAVSIFLLLCALTVLYRSVKKQNK